MSRDTKWDYEVEQEVQAYIDKGWGLNYNTLLVRKRKQDKKKIKVDKLEEKVETIIEAYFGCYSKLMGVEAEYPQGPVALNLELVSGGSGYLYPAMIPLSHGMSILRVFEGYEIKRVDDLNGKKILAYHCNRVLRAVCIPNDDFVIWVDRSIEYSEDALSE